MNIEAYDYRVTGPDEEGEFKALCTEFPDMYEWASTPFVALESLKYELRTHIGKMQEEGVPVPEPLSLHPLSGSFTVETTPELHRRLIDQAAERGLDLNDLVINKLMVEYGK